MSGPRDDDEWLRWLDEQMYDQEPVFVDEDGAEWEVGQVDDL